MVKGNDLSFLEYGIWCIGIFHRLTDLVYSIVTILWCCCKIIAGKTIFLERLNFMASFYAFSRHEISHKPVKLCRLFILLSYILESVSMNFCRIFYTFKVRASLNGILNATFSRFSIGKQISKYLKDKNCFGLKT